MRFIYGKQDFRTLRDAEGVSYLLTNGLGGYSAVTAAYSATRSDAGILVAAVKAPNERIAMVQRIGEEIEIGDRRAWLSTQTVCGCTCESAGAALAFSETSVEDGKEGRSALKTVVPFLSENGYKNLSLFSYDYTPFWRYELSGIRVERQIAMAWEENAVSILYTIENLSQESCTLNLTPWFKFAAKEDVLENTDKKFSIVKKQTNIGGKQVMYEISSAPYTLYLQTDAQLEKQAQAWQMLSYPEDAKDGRPEKGFVASCCCVSKKVEAGKSAQIQLVFSLEKKIVDGWEMLRAQRARLGSLAANAFITQRASARGSADPLASQLVLAADAFIAQRASTGGKTILAGYPLFSDWGRDTMIALPGCCLATGRCADAKSILRTFLVYEKDGLVPNLFPEGETKPMYNTVDAALLLIDCVWQYIERTQDMEFLQEAYPVMERIITYYKEGTAHAIFMDSDGLISAGAGLDQVTWMDVCVNGILPTPRHGKPVEINAYWYNALKIMEHFAKMLGYEDASYRELAELVKKSFVEKFYIAENDKYHSGPTGCLKDVLSGTKADTQIRCNQIWAVSMPFTMLSPEQEKRVVETVYRHLYTPCGLRTLSPFDEEYHGTYGGPQAERDMAYHQGTVWPFPLGAYYRAYLKIHEYSESAKAFVRSQMDALWPMLREGCAGQIPEIYEGDYPSESKGCYAQAWSVGELLRVLECIAER